MSQPPDKELSVDDLRAEVQRLREQAERMGVELLLLQSRLHMMATRQEERQERGRDVRAPGDARPAS